jgi:hypothetical protein
MTPTTVAPAAFVKSGPGWRYRFESIPIRRLRGFGMATVLVGLVGMVQAINMMAAPARHSAEGVLVRRAWIVSSAGSLGRVTDWYDHPPLGWLLLSGWASLTGAFERAPTAVGAGRELALVAHLVTASLLWVLARRLRLARWSAALAVVLFGLSPLAVELHRQVSLDNLAMPWIIAAFTLSCSPRRQLAAFAASGACLAVGMLVNEAALLLLPLLGWQVWQSSLPSTRRYGLVLAGSMFVLVGGVYVAGVALAGELVAGGGHAGLVDGVRFVFEERPFRSSSPLPGASPFDLDPAGLVLMLVAVPVALVAVPRLRPLAACALLLAVLALGPGDLWPAAIVALLPFGAVTVAGVADHAWRRPTGRRWFHRSAVAGALAIVVWAVVGWVGEDHRLLTEDSDVALTSAERWLVDNVPRERSLIVDDALWVDLVESGFPPEQLAAYGTVEVDADVGPAATGSWSDYRLVVVTDPLRTVAEAGRGSIDEGVRRSVPVAIFGAGSDRVEVRRIVTEGPATVANANDHDRIASVSAGTALARNRSIDLTPGARAALVAGEVDERLMTTLVALAVDHPLLVSSFPLDPGEAAAGVPRRVVELRAATEADARALAELLAHQEPPYQPAAVDIGAGGAMTVTYLPAAVI